VVTPDDFQLLLSLTLLLILLVGGRNTVTGALLAGMILALFPVLQQHVPTLANIAYLLTGLGAVSIGQNPDGIGGQLAAAGERLRELMRWGPPIPLEVERAGVG